MIRVEYFCTRCNGSAQRRDPGDEVNTGYHADIFHTATEAKRDCGIHPAKWALDATGRLVCPACCAGRTGVHRDAAEATAFNDHYGLEGDERVAPADARLSEGGWPSRETPFGGTSGQGDDDRPVG